MAVYRCRWGIEQLFKDCKTAGYHLEETKVNDTRFLALVLLIAMASSLATLYGQERRKLGIEVYAGRINEHADRTPRQSDFSLGLYAVFSRTSGSFLLLVILRQARDVLISNA